MPVEQLVDAIRDLIKKNLIARSNVISDVTTGDTVVYVENTFQFYEDQEIILIDCGYNNPSHPHYKRYEYSRVKEVSNTNSLELYTPIIDNWALSDMSFVQKTIGHDPLYESRVYYGDRAVIPTAGVAITVDPQSMSNEWIYFTSSGTSGLSEDYKLNIRVYVKDAETEVGYKILNKYSHAVYRLLNDNIQLDITDYDAPLLQNALSGTSTIVLNDTPDNRRYFVPSTETTLYGVQDNNSVEKFVWITNVSYGGSQITLTLYEPLTQSFTIRDAAVFIKYGRYVYDARASQITYGITQKASALMRVAEINWFGKEVNEIQFTQHSRGVDFHSEHY